jgi:ABC-type transport system involved in multi-copper enzyme maturation permease subunit
MRLELGWSLKRPLYWILAIMLGVFTWMFWSGGVTVSTGDSAVGGEKLWVNSEFNVAFLTGIYFLLFYVFFVAIAAGMPVIQDEDEKVARILHSTRMNAGEYVWGRFLGVIAVFGIVVAINTLFYIFFLQIAPMEDAANVRGPFHLIAFIRPTLLFTVPPLVFTAGVSYFIGERTRMPILVFLLPVAMLMGSLFFLWNFDPDWLPPFVNQILMAVDPTGFRWLAQVYLEDDRGVAFYNVSPVAPDALFIVSRLVLIAIGLGAVATSQALLHKRVRGGRSRPVTDLQGLIDRAEQREAARIRKQRETKHTPISTLGMTTRRTGFLEGAMTVARAEVRELRASPGLYLFTPLILLQVIGTSVFATGAFDTLLLHTSGTLAVRSFGQMTTYLCLLLLFYTVESLRREPRTRIAPIQYTSPVRTTSVLFGKAIANSIVGIAVVVLAFVGCALVPLYQTLTTDTRTPAIELWPFILVWGVLLVPTLLLWSSFVVVTYSVTRNRWGTYGVCLAVLMLTGVLLFRGKMNWVDNWPLWGVLPTWSDIGGLELNETAFWLNRLIALSLAAFFVLLGVRMFPRRAVDAQNVLLRLRPLNIFKQALRLAPFWLIPVILGSVLYVLIDRGFQGDKYEKAGKDYWRQNLATWRNAPLPAIDHIELKLELDPDNRAFKVDGSYRISNPRLEPLRQIPLTCGLHYKDIKWTLDGEPITTDSDILDDRSNLFVFTLPTPLAEGESVTVGFNYHGVMPEGITRNGGGLGEFILDAGVVLTGFSPSFVPTVGFVDGVGVDEDNSFEPESHRKDLYKEQNDPLFGSAWGYTTHVEISGPPEYTYNSVGVLVSDETTDGVRTMTWETDQPVRIFNVVAGKWDVRRGEENTAIYYYPEHDYNVDAMIEAFDASRKYYSEWFYPYPWRELKLSEFPALAGYAQGFATNITFSESIGFLSRPSAKADTVFFVTAHETAHQWWGNILTPGRGPGANILSEGMANFSSGLLFEQAKGLGHRIEFFKSIERQYTSGRSVDSERPMVQVDGTKTGDGTITYNKGGWVFWMLLNHMGRDNALAGMQEFIRRFKDGPDFPFLEDLVEVMREYAPDEASYDAFVNQWFFDVVLPEYQFVSDRDGRTTLAQVEGASTPDDDTDDVWEVRTRVFNNGTSTMPVEIAAARMEQHFLTKEYSRFDDDGVQHEDYADSRVTLTLGPGDTQEAVIRCDFEPNIILVDPDAKVLQLRRDKARQELSESSVQSVASR